MITNLENKEDVHPLVKGIRLIGIGKHGSKDLPQPLLEELLRNLPTEDANPIQKGAFFGALRTKGATATELILEDYLGKGALSEPERLYDRLCADSPVPMKPIGVKLLKGETLSVDEARELGNFLFSNQPGEAFRGMAMSILRIRYESDEEYQGLMQAVEATYAEGFTRSVTTLQPLIQLAEPFDGVEHSYMITPVLAQALQKEGYGVVSTVGRSSGPKLCLDAWQLYRALGADFLPSNNDLLNAPPAYGWVLDQRILSPALDQWVDRRRSLIKRPFLATLEKVLNPTKAQLLITSVFHLTYIEKMVELGMMAGFMGVIVLKRGLEGTLAPSLSRATGILCAARLPGGSVALHRVEADSDAFAHYRADKDDIVERPDAQQNAHLVSQFVQAGATGNNDFDQRCRLGVDLYTQGVRWVASQWAL
jgi:anthranilate phosphoribosyltransferase